MGLHSAGLNFLVAVLAAGLLGASATGWATITGTLKLGEPAYMEDFTSLAGQSRSGLYNATVDVISGADSPFANRTDVYSVFWLTYMEQHPTEPLGVQLALTVEVPDAEDNQDAGSTVQGLLQDNFVTASDLNSRLGGKGYVPQQGMADYITNLNVEAQAADTLKLTALMELQIPRETVGGMLVDQENGNQAARDAFVAVTEETLDNYVDERVHNSSCCTANAASATAAKLLNDSDEATEMYSLINLELNTADIAGKLRYRHAIDSVAPILLRSDLAVMVNPKLLEDFSAPRGYDSLVLDILRDAVLPGELLNGGGSGLTTVEVQLDLTSASVRSLVLNNKEQAEAALEKLFKLVPIASLNQWELLPGDSEREIVGRFTLEVDGAEGDVIATKVAAYAAEQFDWTASFINNQFEKQFNISEDVVNKLIKLVPVPGKLGSPAAVITLGGAMRLGSSDYQGMILHDNQVQAQAKQVFGNITKRIFDAPLPAYDIVDVAVSAGEDSEDLNAKVAMSIPATTASDKLKNIAEELLEVSHELNAENLNELLNMTVGPPEGSEPYIAAVKSTSVSAGNTISQGDNRTIILAVESTMTAQLSNANFTESDYDDKTEAYTEFRDAFENDVKSKVSTECDCAIATAITSVEFNTNERRRLLSNHDVTITASITGAGQETVEDALDGARMLGGATVEGDIEVGCAGCTVDDDGAHLSHICVACLALLLCVLAAVIA